MLSLAADDSEQGRAMGNNQAMQVGAESISGLAGGALAALLIKLPLVVFAGVAIVGGLTLLHLQSTPGPGGPGPARKRMGPWTRSYVARREGSR